MKVLRGEPFVNCCARRRPASEMRHGVRGVHHFIKMQHDGRRCSEGGGCSFGVKKESPQFMNWPRLDYLRTGCCAARETKRNLSPERPMIRPQ